MLQEILWLDGGDTIIRGTGTQNHYNYVTPELDIILGKCFSIILCICVDILNHRGEFDCLVLELQQLFSVSQWKTAIFVWAAA